MKKTLLTTAAAGLTAGLIATLLSMTAPWARVRTVEAQACCNPPVAPWPPQRWAKNTVVHVKIQAGVFDSIEEEAIKDAFREFDARSVNNCSNVSYPEPYEVVSTPPSPDGDVFYVKYNGEFTAPSQASAAVNRHP